MQTKLERFALGFDDLLADVYWLQFVQYIGDSCARQKDGSRFAQRQLETVLSLAPHFVEPYYFASFVIGAEQKRPEEAGQILDKGISANPDNWYLPFIAGFNQYLNAHNNERASNYYQLASQCSGAPVWLARQASLLSSMEDNDIKQFAVWSGIYHSTNNASLRATTSKKLIPLAERLIRESQSENVRRVALKQIQEIQKASL